MSGLRVFAATIAPPLLAIGLLSAPQPQREGLQVRPFDLQGHRGARGLAPENTLAGFATALGVGVTTLEMDLAITGDGHVVVSHDPSLNPNLTRDAEGNWLQGPGPRIHSLTLAELRRYDVGRLRPGSREARLFPEQVPVDGQRIPTLREVFELVERAGNSQVRFNLETKINPLHPEWTTDPRTFAEAVVAAVRANSMERRTTVQSFDWRTLQHVRRLTPEISTACLTVQEGREDNVRVGRPGAPLSLAGLDVDDYGGSVPRLVKAAGCRIWSPYVGDLSAATLDEAHRLHLEVVVWSANDPKRMRKLIERDVDGVITDRPDLLRRVMAAMGLVLPEATPVAP